MGKNEGSENVTDFLRKHSWSILFLAKPQVVTRGCLAKARPRKISQNSRNSCAGVFLSNTNFSIMFCCHYYWFCLEVSSRSPSSIFKRYWSELIIFIGKKPDNFAVLKHIFLQPVEFTKRIFNYNDKKTTNSQLTCQKRSQVFWKMPVLTESVCSNTAEHSQRKNAYDGVCWQ